ncbi:pyroglutamyl-peptidase 1 isoform X2 [Trachinotus anak]|uniref:pyroglutamyl-peptidase 1 isoform X2 n=1 Tax=Trachinotus anak TaxID=443729 RepID=UPI0039F251AB
MANKKKVIVTGFEPFGEHAVNSSWVAVQELERLGLGEAVDLYVCEVPVEYQAVQSLLPSLWREHQPQCCMENGPDCINSVLDMDAVCKRVNDSNIGVAVSVSKDAGRYLCDYTYYTSLYLGQGCSAFIHVPPLGKPYCSQDLGRALQAVIQEMLNLLEPDHTEEEHKHNEHCGHKHQHQHDH